MENIEKHIEADQKILEDPTTSPQQRRHIEEELHELEVYVEKSSRRNRRIEIIMILHHWNFIVKSNQEDSECKVHDN